jgi:hypothetical protein
MKVRNYSINSQYLIRREVKRSDPNNTFTPNLLANVSFPKRIRFDCQISTDAIILANMSEYVKRID